MAYLQILPDLGMNYTLNRPLFDGQAKARIREVSAVAPQIKDFESWYTVWLGLAQKAEREQRWLDAATYYHQAEFYLPAGDQRNQLYDNFARNYALGMKGVAGYERHQIPYPGGSLPGFRLPAKGKELATLVFHGGYDSFVEEFYPFLEPFTDHGWTVLGFDGPGQGGALRQGIFFTHEWERFAKAVLDYFDLNEVDWLGASCGGYLALRAAAFEPRIKHVISLPATYWGLDMALKQMTPGKDKYLVSLFQAGDRTGVETLVAEQRQQSTCFDWCIMQGMHITGTKTPFDCLTSLSTHNLEGVLHHIKQDVLVTEGEDDHLFNVDWIYRIMRELVCARSVTARIFTAREGAEQHCQVGNSALAREEITRWLSRFHPEIAAHENQAVAVA
ncbi:MAG: alpha/beta fold hydrolase [Acidobacteriaceae bacterium]|nr:alpha/beta fold hydrolase [Acidobacteriaceae bacterium]MBV9938388.1 alpha/beta fold hydrolase [Acidobacteriaceae bacterium]